jgi:Fic family protein
LHYILTKKLWITGNIRKNIVWITWTKYKPLDNQFKIKEALGKMVELINYKQNFFDKAFLSLLFISYIQSFEDWNKRTARLLTNAILLSNNSIPLSYIWVDVIEYKKATILFYELNNLTYFKKIFIEQFEDSVRNYFN